MVPGLHESGSHQTKLRLKETKFVPLRRGFAMEATGDGHMEGAVVSEALKHLQKSKPIRSIFDPRVEAFIRNQNSRGVLGNRWMGYAFVTDPNPRMCFSGASIQKITKEGGTIAIAASNSISVSPNTRRGREVDIEMRVRLNGTPVIQRITANYESKHFRIIPETIKEEIVTRI